MRKKNQVNALVKILCDFSMSTVVYFLVGYGVAQGPHGAQLRGLLPLGAPVFIATTWPNSAKPLIRLMVAQDTGGAIRGPVRRMRPVRRSR